MDSPNVAKVQQDPTMKGFENKGYFHLFARTIKGNLTLVDRSSRKADLKKMVAEIISVDSDPYSHQIVINKGAINDVFEGQPVLDDKGIVGQIMQVSSTNSRVLLIADVTHAIPVRIARNNVRLVVSGSGSLSELIIQHVAHSSDLKVGDLLLSSGLGNVFPEGYPVATITSIIRDESRPFSQVRAKPVAQLDRLKYLLLLWSDRKSDNAPAEIAINE